MKKPPLPLYVMVLLALLAATAISLQAASPDEVFRSARGDFNQGDLDAARAKFESILKSNPNHAGSKAYLHLIEQRQSTSGSLDAKIDRIMLTGIQFNKASLDSVLEFLTKASRESSQGATVVNFVPNIPREELAAREVTLQLSGPIPFREVMRYVGEVANVRFTIERFAVKVENAVPGAPPDDSDAGEGADAPS